MGFKTLRVVFDSIIKGVGVAQVRVEYGHFCVFIYVFTKKFCVEFVKVDSCYDFPFPKFKLLKLIQVIKFPVQVGLCFPKF